MGAKKELSNTGEMDVNQAAEYCGIGRQKIYNAIAEKQGPRHMKRFGRLVFLAADLDAWVKANTVIKKSFGR